MSGSAVNDLASLRSDQHLQVHLDPTGPVDVWGPKVKCWSTDWVRASCSLSGFKSRCKDSNKDPKE